MSKVIVGTIVAENYLPAARVLTDSFRRHHPQIPLQVLLAGGHTACRAGKKAGLDVLRISDLGLPDVPRLFPGYNRQQVVVALKPFLLEHLLKSSDGTAVFLDADILVTDSLDPLFAEVAQHSMSVTPHVGLSGPKPGRSQIERTLLLAGMYNGGFVGVTQREETRRFLSWWKQRLTTHCKCAPAEGFVFDQRWLDLAPGFVTDFHVVRDPGCNVAYWNLPELEVTRSNDALRVNGSPLRFFHFSGFDAARPDEVSRHSPGSKVDELGMPAELFHHYRMLLEKAGWADAIHAPWSWQQPAPGLLQRLRSSLARWFSRRT
jgi:hypothetical protein